MSDILRKFIGCDRFKDMLGHDGQGHDGQGHDGQVCRVFEAT